MGTRRAGSMVVGAASGGEAATAEQVVNKPAEDLEMAFIPLTTLESISLGFRQSMFEIKNDLGDGGEVMSTGGFGGSTLILEWREGDDVKQAAVDCVDLLIRWVDTFDPKAAEALRKAATR